MISLETWYKVPMLFLITENYNNLCLSINLSVFIVNIKVDKCCLSILEETLDDPGVRHGRDLSTF